MEIIKMEIMDNILEGEYQVLNSTAFMNLIEKYSLNKFHSALNQLHDDKRIRFDCETDGMKIYRVEVK